MHVERPRSNPATWDEACVQREMLCLDGSVSGTVVFPFLAPFVIFTSSEISPEIIARHCQLQGELCRLRSQQR